MTKHRLLTLGTDHPTPTTSVKLQRCNELVATVEHYIPDFADAIKNARSQGAGQIVLHQDAFAAAYDEDEFTLLAMAIKYAGLHRVTVVIVSD